MGVLLHINACENGFNEWLGFSWICFYPQCINGFRVLVCLLIWVGVLVSFDMIGRVQDSFEKWPFGAWVFSEMGVAAMLLMIKDFQCLNPCSSGIEVLLGENPLRCTTQDKKGLVLIVLLFYPIFWSHKK